MKYQPNFNTSYKNNYTTTRWFRRVRFFSYLSTLLRRAFSFFWDLIFPACCAGCGREEGFLCVSCKQKLFFIPPQCFVCKKLSPGAKRITPGRTCVPCRKKSFIYAFFSPFSYDNKSIRDLIHSFKYKGVSSVASIFSEIIFSYLNFYGIALPREIVAMPIPLSRIRERIRGFNQAGLIAKHFSEQKGISFTATALKKVKNTKPQVELSSQERRKSVIGSFAVSREAGVGGKDILLIDDVKTTGSTLEEAARTLKAAGARRVYALTIAH